MIHFDAIARNRDDALDVGLAGIAREPKYDGIAAVDFSEMQAIDEFVDKNALLVIERGHHAGAFHFHRLIEEENHDDGQDDRENEIARPVNDRAEEAAF